MFIISPYIFQNYPKIICGVSTMIGSAPDDTFRFNLSLNVGDDKDRVLLNREAFFNHLGFKIGEVVLQNQIHSDIVTVVNSAGNCGESDALITARKNLLLVLTIADCTPILIYDKVNHVVAAIHSGWRGSESQILNKALLRMNNEFNSIGKNLIVYLGPSVSQINYEVGSDVAEKFEDKYLLNSDGKTYLDVAAVNYSTLIEFGVKKVNIQKSALCTFQMKDLLHSYRRDGSKSGRAFAVIGMREL